MTAKRNVTRDSVTNLFKEFAGQGATLVIPRPYIKLCQGDHLAALLLSQILYWTDRTDDPDGWFAKSYEEWQSELDMTKYQVKRAIDGDKRAKTGEAFPGLKAFGVEVTRRRSKFHKGGSTLHYRVNLDALRDKVLSQFSPSGDTPQIVNNVDNQIVNNVDNEKSNVVDDDTTETTTEITSEKKDIAPGGAVSSALMNPMKDAIVAVFGWSWDTMTKSEKGTVHKAAKELCENRWPSEDVPLLYAEIKRRGWKDFKPTALSSVVSDVRKKKITSNADEDLFKNIQFVEWGVNEFLRPPRTHQ